MDIVGIGNPLLDLVAHVPDDFLNALHIEKGSMISLHCDAFQKVLSYLPQKPIKRVGGSTGNTLRTLKKLGRDCCVVGKSSNDEEGQFYIQDLNKRGIEHKFSMTDTPSGQILCLVTPDGERTFVDFLGASTEFSPSDIHHKLFQEAKWVHIEGYCLLNKGVIQKAIEGAKKNGVKISFDLGNFKLVRKFKEELLELLPAFEIVFANEPEVKDLVSLNASEACLQLSSFCKTAAVMTGINGGFVASQDEFFNYPAYPVHPLDTTGAGDAFIAGFLHRYLSNCPLKVCADLGARLAAEAVLVDGALLDHFFDNQV